MPVYSHDLHTIQLGEALQKGFFESCPLCPAPENSFNTVSFPLILVFEIKKCQLKHMHKTSALFFLGIYFKTDSLLTKIVWTVWIHMMKNVTLFKDNRYTEM